MPMRISLVVPSFYPAMVYGGPIFATLHAAEALSYEGIDVYVSSTNANGKTKLDVESGLFIKYQDGLYIKYYDETIINRFSFSMLLGLSKDMKEADVVHIQSVFSMPTPMALVYAKLFGKKVLLSPRGSLCQWCLNEKQSFKKNWLRFLIAPFITDVLWHATSEQEKSDIKAVFGASKVALISDGVNCEEFDKPVKLTPEAFMKRFTGSNIMPQKILVSMGRLHKVKGFDILLNAFKKVLQKYPDAVLLLAGEDDGEKGHLQELSNVLQLEDNLFFTGPLYEQEKRDFLANADLFVLPSHTENFGIVYAESLASGTPIVASTNTPWSEVEETDCGRWVNNSIEETAQAILEVLQKDRETMRVNSKMLAKKYDWKNIALQFKEVFEKMVEK